MESSTNSKPNINSERNKSCIVLTFGVYDLLHKGHVLLFKHAKEKGDFLTVAVQADEAVLKYKPTAKMVNNTVERTFMVESIRYVDRVVTYTDVDEDIKNIEFDILVTGPDQIHSGFQRAIKWCLEHGKKHIVIERTEGISSSMLREMRT